MADHGLLSLLAGLLPIVLFSALAARADQQLWSKCRRRECCLLSQRRITLGKAM
jgi:hypothetical protein